MPFTYDIKPNCGDSHQTSPKWLAAIVRLKWRNTFNPGVIGESLAKIGREAADNNTYGPFFPDGSHDSFTGPPRREDDPSAPSALSGSIPDAASDPVGELPIAILDSEITHWECNNGKGEHVKSLSMTLANVGVNFAKDLAADDWILFWSFDNEEDFRRVRTKVVNGEQANGFDDGLKFVGRLKAPKRQRSRADGRLTTHYMVSAVAFGEFDSTIYFNEILSSKYANESLQWMIDFGGEYNDFISDAAKDGGIASQTALPKLINICLGVGPGAQSKGLNEAVQASFANGSAEAQTAPDLQASPNVAYRIPRTVAKLLGVPDSDSSKAVGLTYFDILSKWVGVQEYTAPQLKADRQQQGDFRWQGFIPGIAQDLDGTFLPYAINLNQTSVWSLLSQYANEPINEMYTALRVTADGSVMPTYICRQLPYSSMLYANGTRKATSFSSMPRWRLAEELVVNDHLGASDSTRVNFVHVMGQDTTGGTTFYNQILGYTRHAPIADQASIMRSGLYPYEKTVSATVIESRETNSSSPGRVWSLLLADIMMGGHLRWSGVIETKGIQEPIAEGDNLEYDGGVYHIERVVHSGGIGPDGRKFFNTQLQVSHGLSVLSDTEPSGYNVYLTTEYSLDDGPQPAGAGLTVEV